MSNGGGVRMGLSHDCPLFPHALPTGGSGGRHYCRRRGGAGSSNSPSRRGELNELAELALMTPSIEALIYSYESSGQQSTHCTNSRSFANDSHNRPFFII